VWRTCPRHLIRCVVRGLAVARARSLSTSDDGYIRVVLYIINFLFFLPC
jgi:hypothetical protein